MKSVVYNAIITQEGEGFVALNPEYDVVSQGESVEAALANLQEALSLYLEELQSNKQSARPTSFLTTFSL